VTRSAVATFLGRSDPPAKADVVIVGAGIGGLAIARELLALGIKDIVVVERGYPGSGATGRNVARIRAMQLTEELTHVARACQDKYDRMGDDLGFNVLFYRLGYAWVLYDADEVDRMREIVAMHHRIGVRSALLSPDDTLRRLPVLRGGDPVAGSVLNDDAIVHHDAVVWAHLEHLAGRAVRLLSGTTVRDITVGDGGVQAVETDRGRIATRVVVNAAGGWSGELNALARVVAPNRPHRREVLVTAPLRRSIDAAITFYRPMEGWFNQTLRGEVVMGVVDPGEPEGVEHGSTAAFLRRTASIMTRKAPALADVTVIRQWAGMYDITPDHLPLVGPTRQLEGWWQANGWSGRGMLLAPYLAELLATRIATGATPARLAMFDPDRFDPATAATDSEQDYYARYATR
jgi:glycine/D-amino acid oxidase-like deaminating enzyme